MSRIYDNFDLIWRSSSLADARSYEAFVGWVSSLRPWQVVGHFTFPWQASVWSARRCFERVCRQSLSEAEYIYFPEPNPGRPGYHVHALLFSLKEISRKGFWSDWFTRYGRALVEPVRSVDDVSAYCSKLAYVCKGGQRESWWNLKVFPHREFKLEVVE
jgi:hypothetical protein